MNRDLIKQLQSLSPTKGEWNNGTMYITSGKSYLFDFIDSDASLDDVDLVCLAPTMRQEILAMAKEIEELRSQLSLAIRDIRSLTP